MMMMAPLTNKGGGKEKGWLVGRGSAAALSIRVIVVLTTMRMCFLRLRRAVRTRGGGWNDGSPRRGRARGIR